MVKKIIQLAFIFISVTLLVACSKGVKALPLIGLSYSYNGFFMDHVKLLNGDTKVALEDKKIKIGETLCIN